MNALRKNMEQDPPIEKLEDIFLRFPHGRWDEVCLPILQEWNEHNNPSMTLAELNTFYAGIRVVAWHKTSTLPESIQKLSEATTLDELLKTEYPEARFTIEHLFEAGTINMLSAPPNKWKSWVVLHAAIVVASGENFLGKFKTEKVPVMIVNEEDNERLLQERFNMLMEEPADLPIYLHIGKQIKITEEFVTELIMEAQLKSIGLMIFDSLRSVHEADENSSQEMQKIMDQLKRISRAGITVLFTHHNRKKPYGGGSKDESGEESRGSSAINAAIHGHLSCEESKHDEQTYLVIRQQKLKADKKLDPFEIRIEHDKTKAKMSFIYDGKYKDHERLETKTKQAIEQFIEKSPSWVGVKDLIDAKLGGGTIVRAALKMLERGGIVRSLKRKEVEQKGLPVANKEGNHNEKLYFRSELVDVMKNQSELSLGP